MPHPPTIANRIRPFTAALIVTLSLIACTSASGDKPPSTTENDAGYRNFLERVEAAEDEGWTPYWLGRSFEAGGLTFQGPGVADFGAEVAGGGISMSYAAETGTGGTAPLYINLYTRDAWSRVRDGITMPRDRTTRQRVTVLGREAELLLISAGTRPVVAARLIIDLGDTVVFADAQSVGSDREGGPDRNPLIIPENLLPVIEQLRPYPE